MATVKKVALLSGDQELAHPLQRLLEGLTTETVFQHVLEGSKEISRIQPDILVFKNHNHESAVEIIQQIFTALPSVVIFFVSDRNDFYGMREVIRAGATDYFVLPDEFPLLEAALEKTIQMLNQREMQSAVPSFKKGRGRVISFYSGKGGSGTTLIAASFAQTLRLDSTARVLLISGGTGSGKTTLLNAVSQAIPHSERVITIEDSAELRLDRPNAIGMESRPPNVEGSGEITIRQLVRNALRMRPGRIIVGEVRGSEAFDMLQAMNTGHEGSLTTVHANSPRDALNRVEGMVIMAGMDLPSQVIRQYIVGALDYIVQSERSADGKRRIVSISEVSTDEHHQFHIKEIFHYKKTGMDAAGNVTGSFMPTGIIPSCLERLKIFGYEVDESIFRRKEPALRDYSHPV